MSFGFITTDPLLEKAIKETENTLMFAASTNFSAAEFPPIRFPARYWERVFSVNVADGRGEPSGSNPPKDRNRQIRNFSFLGEAVGLVNHQASDRGNQPRYGNGSSVATSIASGIAAVVSGISRQDAQLKSLAAIESVFGEMSESGPKKGYRFVAPWQMLSSTSKEYKDQMGDICERISKSHRKQTPLSKR
ncbi:hypothetical protein HYALB_00008664 [Hymenoscyphus albidus]|uniref:Peptidase S8/S53 domain-containing protein n=1 Tax=Hymenoscyphus albidus TaxID=595503 RepID=A0A9N9LFJ3_9HELO|nr:hypothetical protein HYALB_00008664 [Hymenoscyphus albidus]